VSHSSSPPPLSITHPPPPCDPWPPRTQDNTNSGSLAGLQAVNFFRLSGLDKEMLKGIWTVADSRNQFALQREVRGGALSAGGGDATRGMLVRR
jgi:hypothetical protein